MAAFLLLLLTVSALQPTPSLLRPYHPEMVTIAANSSVSYQYPGSRSAISFQITSFAGQSTLQVTPKDSLQQSTCEKAATGRTLLDYSVRCREIEANETYSVTVRAEEGAVVSILAYEWVDRGKGRVWLYEGQPQLGSVYQNRSETGFVDSILYEFPINQGKSVLISLTPLIGSLIMCVWPTLDPNRAHKSCIYEGNGVGADLKIHLNPEKDPFPLSNETYTILVQGKSFAPDLSASFIVSYSVEESEIRVQEGVPQYSEVQQGRYQYYQFPVPGKSQQVTVQVTKLWGETDLYLAVNRPRPSRSLFHWNSTMYGSDGLRLGREEIEKYCLGSNCTLFVAVYGVLRAAYSIRVAAYSGVADLLRLDLPSTGFIQRDKSAHFYTIASTTSPLVVHLQALEGHSHLYVNIHDSQDSLKWTFPSKEQHHYFSQASFAKQVSLSASGMKRLCVSGTCVVHSTAYCAGPLCTYTLSAVQDQVLPLLEGLPALGSVLSGSFAYYKFFNHLENASLRITLTPLSDENPEIYVDRGLTARPSPNNNLWKATSWSPSELLLPAQPLALDGSNMRGFFLIGVRGFYNTSFSLVVTTQATPVMQLIGRVPVRADTDIGQMRCFAYVNTRNEELGVTLTPLMGRGLVQVATFPIDSSKLTKNYPILWSSAASSHPNRLKIAPTDPNFCTNCIFLITILSELARFSFSLSISAADEALLLQSGIPVVGTVASAAWQHYLFLTYVDSDLEISVVNYAGSTELYAGYDPFNPLWHQSPSSEIAHLSISKSDPRSTLGEHWVGVYGSKDSVYAISVQAKQGCATLAEGWPQAYSLQSRVRLQYYVDKGQTAMCQLKSEKPDYWPEVYTQFADFAIDSVQPDPRPDHFQLYFTQKHYDPVYAALTFSLPVPNVSGEYVFSVYSESPLPAAAFELTCYQPSTPVTLLVGRSEYGLLSQFHSKQRFQIYASEPGLLQVTVFTSSETIHIGISANSTGGESDLADLVLSRTADGDFQAEIMNAVGAFYVVLSWKGTEASYEVLYDFHPQGTRRPKQLLAGKEGLILWQNATADRVQLNWSAATYEDGSPVDTVIYYQVYVTNSSANMNTLCALRKAVGQGLVWTPSAQYTTETTALIQPLAHQTQIVTVVSVIPIGSRTVRLLYSPATIRELPEQSSLEVFWLIVAVALLAVVLLGLMVLWWRYRQSQRKAVFSREVDTAYSQLRDSPFKQSLELA